MKFELCSDYKPTGDQPEAIAQLTEGIVQKTPAQTLLGVTGSGKTFTIANVIANVNKPTLILSHNKTLAAQLYSEFKVFFPNNAVEYYVSYYDYYQPEAYLPSTDTYIEKDICQDLNKIVEIPERKTHRRPEPLRNYLALNENAVSVLSNLAADYLVGQVFKFLFIPALKRHFGNLGKHGFSEV